MGEDRLDHRALCHSDVLSACPETENDAIRRGCVGAIAMLPIVGGFANENVVVLGRPRHSDACSRSLHDGGHRDVVLAAPGERVGHVGQAPGRLAFH